jgi:hypothetical protein
MMMNILLIKNITTITKAMVILNLSTYNIHILIHRWQK